MQATLKIQFLFFLPIFFLTIESTRAVLWAVRVADEADRDGPLLRALVARVVSLVGMIPSPVWTGLTYVGCVIWVPVRGVLWVWGIGRGELRKESPKAVSKWYATRRAERLRRQRQKDDSYE